LNNKFELSDNPLQEYSGFKLDVRISTTL